MPQAPIVEGTWPNTWDGGSSAQEEDLPISSVLCHPALLQLPLGTKASPHLRGSGTKVIDLMMDDKGINTSEQKHNKCVKYSQHCQLHLLHTSVAYCCESKNPLNLY